MQSTSIPSWFNKKLQFSRKCDDESDWDDDDDDDDDDDVVSISTSIPENNDDDDDAVSFSTSIPSSFNPKRHTLPNCDDESDVSG